MIQGVSAELSFQSFPKCTPLFLQQFPASLPSPFHTPVNGFSDIFARLHVTIGLWNNFKQAVVRAEVLLLG